MFRRVTTERFRRFGEAYGSPEVSPEKGIRAMDASLGAPNIRFANRRIVVVTLKQCLAVDIPISNFDVHPVARLFVFCSAKVVYLWNMDSQTLLHKFGRVSGSVHRDNIRTCVFDHKAKYISSAGEDKRIVVWSLKTFRAEKVMEGHKGIVYQVKFSDDDEKIFSASDDGRLLVWEWKTGTILASFMRHSSAIRTFDFGHEARIVCGRNDGQMTTWDTSRMSHIDNILPDPDWEKPQESTDSSLLGWADETKHHTGSILCVKVSPNFRLLASGATDHTCKLWSIVSYMRDTDEVEQELEEAEIMREKLEKCIDILETSYDVQIPMRDFTGVKIGEVPIPLAFHADLLFTFCHDAPVLSVQFNSMSDIVITGSMDSTCRLWSARRGDLLFQINTPAPVSCLLMTSPSTLMCVCLNRVLTFEIKAHQKEEELPPYWQRKGYLAEMKLMAEDYAKMTNTDLETMEPMDDTVYRHPMVLFKPGEPGMIARGLEPQQKIHMPELRRLISHGLINPQFLETLLDQYKHIDSETLASNMKRHRMPVNQILKLLVNYNFHPKDILHMLSRRKNSDSIFDMIKQGRSITQYMISEGYKPVPDDDQDESNAIFLNYRDLLPPSEGHWGHRLSQEGMHAVSDYEAIDGIYGHGQGVVPRGQRAATNYDYIEEYDEEYDDESMYFQEGSRYMPPKGKIIHFIPSEQLKLLKDYQANRELKSIFLQQLVLDAHPVQFPNFNIESETVDRKPVVDKKTFPKSGIRFNESVPVPGRRRPGAQQTDLANRFDFSPLLTHGRGNARESQSTEGTQFYSPAPITRKFAKGSFSSSNTIFKPERYLHTRGLNVSFGQQRGGRSGLSQRVFTQPIMIQKAGSRDLGQQLIVGKSVGIGEKILNIDGDDDDDRE